MTEEHTVVDGVDGGDAALAETVGAGEESSEASPASLYPPAPRPTVAIVGRPNVGKSTLFNRLVGRRQAIVHDLPGVTRDRIFGTAELDDDRSVELIDTGGLVPGDDPLGLGDQVGLAVEESDLLVLVVDGREGLTAADERVWTELRPTGKHTVVAVNKGDTKDAQERYGEFFSFGLDQVVLVSAEHGIGVEDLRQSILGLLPVPEEEAQRASGAPAIAIVGRPNVGKSSLLNRLVGQQRTLVSPVAGTTRDPIDTLVEVDGESYVLIDTAGIRRRAKVTGAAEGLAVMMARRQIERAEIAVLVVDASAGVTSGDLAIAGSIWEMGRAAVVVVNKWDLLDEEAREKLELSFERLDTLLSGPPRVNVSALTGRAVEKIFGRVAVALERFRRSYGTSDVNRFFEVAVQRNPPPVDRHGKPWKLYYSTQVSTGPPTFMIFANRKLPLSDSYRRYLQNRLRETFDLAGVPVRLVIRQR
ncbi:MAG: ribosome biogenesis GTPase Der [Acidobacteriota bacterium]